MRLPLYFLSTLAYYWLPVIALGAWRLPKEDPLTRKAFLTTLAVFYPVSFVLEYVYLAFDLWSFSEAVDPLLGLRVFGVPVEEFFFWYGAQAFCILVYLAFARTIFRSQEPRHA